MVARSNSLLERLRVKFEQERPRTQHELGAVIRSMTTATITDGDREELNNFLASIPFHARGSYDPTYPTVVFIGFWLRPNDGEVLALFADPFCDFAETPKTIVFDENVVKTQLGLAQRAGKPTSSWEEALKAWLGSRRR